MPDRTSGSVVGAGRRRLVPALVVLGMLLALALLAPFLAGGQAPAMDPRGGHEAPSPVSPPYAAVRLAESLESPSPRHPFGTDLLGRDLLARVLYGARVSLLVGFGATLVALVLGALLGGVAGFLGGHVDLVLGRMIEVLGCFPAFVLALALVTVTGGAGLAAIVIAIGTSRAAGAARFIRGEILRWRVAGHWTAARASGAGLPRLAFRHLLPLVSGPLAVQAAYGVANAILLESSLSFLGLGVQPPTPSWGILLAEGRASLETAWWPIVFPAAALALTLAGLGWAAAGAEFGPREA